MVLDNMPVFSQRAKKGDSLETELLAWAARQPEDANSGVSLWIVLVL
jgi:hypothetical protein